MAYFFRLILAACLVAFSFSAHALLPRTTQSTYTYQGKSDLTAVGACERYWISIGGTVGTAGNPGAVITLLPPATCGVRFYSKGVAGSYQTWATQVTEVVSCPANSTAFDDQCKCVDGYYQDGGACVPEKVCPPLGASASGPEMATGGATYSGGPLCVEGCLLAPNVAGQSDGKWYAWGPWSSIGVNCQGDGGGGSGGAGDAEAQQPPQQCPVGQCPGQVNGVDVCVPCGSTATSNTSSSTSTSTTSAGTSTGTTSTSTDVQCSGDKCTITKTTTTTSGSGSGATTSTSTDKKEVPKETFCTENPKSPLCKEGSFSGACAAGFSCDGDAVQCAVAREQHVRNCSLFEGTSGERSLYDSEKGKTGFQGGPVESISVGPAVFDTSNPLGGSGCITDRTVTVAGASISLPFSVICPQLAIFGNILLAVSFLLAVRIVTRG